MLFSEWIKKAKEIYETNLTEKEKHNKLKELFKKTAI